jgi:hypothetical protein
MTTHESGMAPIDLMELGEMLQFIHRWLSGQERDTLAASFERFMGTPAYDLDALRNDVLRFAFLLGADDDERFISGQ